MDGTEELRRREFLQRTAMTAGLAAGMATVLSPDVLLDQLPSDAVARPGALRRRAPPEPARGDRPSSLPPEGG